MRNEHTVLPPDRRDPEDFAVTASALDRAQKAKLVRTARTTLKLSQVEFATRFHVPLGTLRDWEQARVTAPDFAIAYVKLIQRDPEMVAAAIS